MIGGRGEQMISTATLQGPYVFLSYSRSEEVGAKRLEQDLRVYGLQVWRDESSIDPGSPDWEEAIREAISHAYAVVLIASPSVIQSRYIKGELVLAKRYHPNRIYPVWIGGTNWSDCVPLDFINTQYIDIRGGKYEEGFKVLVTVLQKAKERPSPPQQGSAVYQQGSQQVAPLSASLLKKRRAMSNEVKVALISTVGVILVAIITAILGPVLLKGGNEPTPAPMPTAILSPATATAIASHYPFSNHLVLDDPLSDNSRGSGWNTYSYAAEGQAQFTGGAFHLSIGKQGYGTSYTGRTTFRDFTYQVQMTIVKGDAGGIIFRAVKPARLYYILFIDTQGQYDLRALEGDSSGGENSFLLSQGSLRNFTTGLGQPNLIAVVARGSTLEIYVNEQPSFKVISDLYGQGNVGIAVREVNTPTEVVFSNAKVWEL